MTEKITLMEVVTYTGDEMDNEIIVTSVDDVHAMRIAIEGLYKAGAVPENTLPFVRLYEEE